MSAMLVGGAATCRAENFGAERRPVGGEEADPAYQTSPLAIVTAQGRPSRSSARYMLKCIRAAQPHPARSKRRRDYDSKQGTGRLRANERPPKAEPPRHIRAP